MTAPHRPAAILLALAAASGVPGSAQSAPTLVAHRGHSAIAPENTLAAVRAAAGPAGAVEFDVRETADGVLVAMHDATVDRTTDGSGAVASLTFAQVRALDAGSWFDPSFAGERVPTLAEVLAECRRLGLVPVLERKAGSAAAVVSELQRTGSVGSTILTAFDWTFLTAAHRLAPGLQTMCVGSGRLDPAAVQGIVATGATRVSWAWSELDPAAIARARQAGLAVWAWTLDVAAPARYLAAEGVEALIANDPARLATILASPAPPVALGAARLLPDDPTTNTPTLTLDRRRLFDLQPPAANRGDYDLGIGPGADGRGEPLAQFRGVLLASRNRIGAAVPTSVEVPGMFTAGGNLSNGGTWIAMSPLGAGGERSAEVAVCWFPFAEGWIGGHVRGNGSLAFGGNLPAGTSITRAAVGRYVCRLPGLRPSRDGVLHVVGASNEDNCAAAAALPDDSGWLVALRDNGQDFAAGEDDDWSFVFAPYERAAAFAAVTGRVGSNANQIGAGAAAWTAQRLGPGDYLLRIPGVDDAGDGVLAVTAAQLVSGEPDDNVFAHAFDAGLGGFRIESLDLPGGSPQDSGFAFTFVPFHTASLSAAGVGCPGGFARTPSLTARSLPQLGHQGFALRLVDAGVGAFASLLIAPRAATTPRDLGGGCQVQVDLSTPGFPIDVPANSPVSNLGATRFDLSIPADPALAGLSVHGQALVVDPRLGGALRDVAWTGTVVLGL